MSSENSTSYSDAQSNTNDDENPVASGSSHSEDSHSHSKTTTAGGSWLSIRSETLFLAVLFTLIALLLPLFFSFAARPVQNADVLEDRPREFPLKALLPYLPTVNTIFRVSLKTLQVSLRPIAASFTLILALLAPVFIFVQLLYKGFVLLPMRIVTEVARTLYPVYVFCGVAGLFGAGVGIGGRLVIEGARWIFVQNNGKKGRRRI